MRNRTRRLPGVIIALCLLVAMAGSSAPHAAELASAAIADGSGGRAVPGTVWYQGFLANVDTGDPINDTVNIVAELFSDAAGGASLWGPEVHNGVTVVEGWFNIELGTTASPLPDFDNPPYYLQLEVNGEVMDARQKLASAPAAIRAGSVDGGGGGISGGGDAGNLALFTGTTQIGNSVIGETDGRVTVDADTSDAKLRVESNGDLAVLKLVSNSSGTPRWVAWLERTQPMDYNESFLHMDSPYGSDSTFAYINCWQRTFSGGYTAWTLGGSGRVYASGPYELQHYGNKGFDALTLGESALASSVRGEQMATFPAATAVEGDATSLDGAGIGGWFEGGSIGAYCSVEPTGSSVYMGLSGDCTGGSGINIGVQGTSTGSGTNYGVYGEAISTSARAESWAGWFTGNVRVTGTINPTVARYEIDNPRDPENRYLAHALVGSDEMKNVYDGVVRLDGSGTAVVELPHWFEALNGDVRYQLTAVGAPAPELHIARKIENGSFAIAGGPPGLEVSWQVTGIRRDATALSRPIVVESEKSDSDRGSYLDPASYGVAEETGIGRRKPSKAVESRKAAKRETPPRRLERRE